MILSVITDNENLLTYNKPKDNYLIPKYPIILCHGFSGFDHLFQLPMFSSPPLTDRFKSIFNKITYPSFNQNSNLNSNSNSKSDINPIPNSEIDSKLSSNDSNNFNNNEKIPKSNKLFDETKKNFNDKTIQNMGIDNKSIAEKGKYLLEYWNGIKNILDEKGCNVLIAKVPPFASIETRAKILNEFIENSLPFIKQKLNYKSKGPIKINLIAHSMGGLDCRYLINKINKKNDNNNNSNNNYQIVSLTTISTPHRGTSVANFVLKYVPSSIIENQFPSIFQLSTDYAYQFNDLIKDDPNVRYFSYGARMKPNPTSMFLITWKIINDNEGPNDGMVSLKSAKWGEFKGFLEDVDHADLINWMGIIKKTKLSLGLSTFNPTYFYLDIMNNLAINDL